MPHIYSFYFATIDANIASISNRLSIICRMFVEEDTDQ